MLDRADGTIRALHYGDVRRRLAKHLGMICEADGRRPDIDDRFGGLAGHFIDNAQVHAVQAAPSAIRLRS